MKYKIIIFTNLIFSLLLASCVQEKSCETDPEVDKFFKKHLIVVSNINSGSAIGGEKYISLFFLESLTGITSNVNYGDISVYERKKDKKEDLQNWQKWYNKHECSLQIDSLIALEKKIISRNTWIQSD